MRKQESKGMYILYETCMRNNKKEVFVEMVQGADTSPVPPTAKPLGTCLPDLDLDLLHLIDLSTCAVRCGSCCTNGFTTARRDLSVLVPGLCVDSGVRKVALVLIN